MRIPLQTIESNPLNMLPNNAKLAKNSECFFTLNFANKCVLPMLAKMIPPPRLIFNFPLAKPQFPVTPTKGENQRPQQTSSLEFEAVKMQATKRNYDSRRSSESGCSNVWLSKCQHTHRKPIRKNKSRFTWRDALRKMWRSTHAQYIRMLNMESRRVYS